LLEQYQYKKENLENGNLNMINGNIDKNFIDLNIERTSPLSKILLQKNVTHQSMEAKPQPKAQPKSEQKVTPPKILLQSLPQDNLIIQTMIPPIIVIAQVTAPNVAQQKEEENLFNQNALLDKILLDTKALKELQLRSGISNNYIPILKDIILPNKMSNLNTNTMPNPNSKSMTNLNANTIPNPNANSTSNPNANTMSNSKDNKTSTPTINSTSNHIPNTFSKTPPKAMPSFIANTLSNPLQTPNTTSSTTYEEMSNPIETPSTLPNLTSESVLSSTLGKLYNTNFNTTPGDILNPQVINSHNSNVDPNAKIKIENIQMINKNVIKSEFSMPISNMMETDYDKLPYYKQKTKKNTKNNDIKTKINIPKKNPNIYYNDKLFDLRHSGRFEEGGKLIKDMINSNIKPTIYTMNSYISIAADYSDINKVQEIYENLKLNSLILNKIQGGAVVLPRSITNYKNMEGPDVYPNLRTMRELLILYTNEGEIIN
jgi:translation initiation factor IF-3